MGLLRGVVSISMYIFMYLIAEVSYLANLLCRAHATVGMDLINIPNLEVWKFGSSLKCAAKKRGRFEFERTSACCPEAASMKKNIHIYIYRKPMCPLFFGFEPFKRELFQSKQGSFGFQVYIYMLYPF